MKIKIKRALISVNDKSNLSLILEQLNKEKVEIISTGGTLKKIQDLGYQAISISEYTNQAEILDGRVKTLDYHLYASLLYDRNNLEHTKEIEKLNIPPIDLVICNLYPFSQVAKDTNEISTLIENIDIGGPTMLRAAAKNFHNVCVIPSPIFYQEYIDHYDSGINLEFREKMAIEVFNELTQYNQNIAFKLDHVLQTNQVYQPLRYGENSHQKAWIKQSREEKEMFIQLWGKDLSYNNLIDMDAAFTSCHEASLALENKYYSVSIIKHTNPCGLALDIHKSSALINAWNGDSKSAFGSILCFNFEVDENCAHFFDDKFVEVIMAPSFSSEGLKVLKQKKNLRIIKTNSFNREKLETKSIINGELIQSCDHHIDHEFQVVTEMTFNDFTDCSFDELARFGSICAKSLKSNAICFVEPKDSGFWLAGSGMGQPNRIDSMQMLAAKRLKDNNAEIANSIMISDAFFPFRDSIDSAAELGVKMIIQPGGSIKDKDVIKACNEHGMAMAFTHFRHFKH